MSMIAVIISIRRALGVVGSHLGMRRMKTALHIGVHRTATTSFQHLLDRNEPYLAENGVAVWTPRNLRGGIFSGMVRPPHDTSKACERSTTMIGLSLARLRRKSTRYLIVSEENMMGTIRVNMNAASLYPQATPRLARFAAAFGETCDQIVMSIRSYDSYWASCFAFAASVGMPADRCPDMNDAASDPRGWRDVIRDVAAQFPRVPLHVAVFEDAADSNQLLLAQLAQHSVDAQDLSPMPGRCNVSAAGTTPAFTPKTRQLLRDRYTADLDWLHGGADGIATLITPTHTTDMDRIGADELTKVRQAATAGGHHGNEQRLV